jgi:hypothetical protein
MRLSAVRAAKACMVRPGTNSYPSVGGLPPESSTRCAEGRAIDLIRLAKKNSLSFQEVNKFSQIDISQRKSSEAKRPCRSMR